MDWASDEVLMLIFEAVSDGLDTPMEKLPPLSESINPNAVEEIMTADSSHDVTVTFSYAGLRVLVHSDMIVSVSPINERLEIPPRSGSSPDDDDMPSL